MLQDFQLILCLTIFYFRVNPLYTKHVLKSVEHYFSHITVRKKITKTWPNLAGGGGYPHFGKNRTLSVFFLKASLSWLSLQLAHSREIDDIVFLKSILNTKQYENKHECSISSCRVTYIWWGQTSQGKCDRHLQKLLTDKFWPNVGERKCKASCRSLKKG